MDLHRAVKNRNESSWSSEPRANSMWEKSTLFFPPGTYPNTVQDMTHLKRALGTINGIIQQGDVFPRFLTAALSPHQVQPDSTASSTAHDRDSITFTIKHIPVLLTDNEHGNRDKRHLDITSNTLLICVRFSQQPRRTDQQALLRPLLIIRKRTLRTAYLSLAWQIFGGRRTLAE